MWPPGRNSFADSGYFANWDRPSAIVVGSASSRMKPSSANLMAGATMSAQATLWLPNFWYRRSQPAATPGIFATVGPSFAVRAPLGVKSLGLSAVAWLGDMSLYSTTTGSVMPLRNRMAWPSPPRLVASGSTTPRAMATAMPASTTLPPASIIWAPAAEASGFPEVTTARVDSAPGLMSGCSAIMASTTVSNEAMSVARAAAGRYLSRRASQTTADGPAR